MRLPLLKLSCKAPRIYAKKTKKQKKKQQREEQYDLCLAVSQDHQIKYKSFFILKTNPP